MGLLGDISDAYMRRHMTVARGSLALPSAHMEALQAQPDALQACLAPSDTAALQAAKTASMVLPGLAPYQLTDCFTELALVGDGVELTVTLQAYHRAPLDRAALLAASAALVELGCLLAPGQPWRVEGLHVVQSVQND